MVISARKYDHMEGRIAVIWTPCVRSCCVGLHPSLNSHLPHQGRDYFLIIGKCSSAVAARVALSLFFRLSQSPPSDGAKNPQHIPPIEKHQDIFDNIFKKIRVLDEKTRSIVDILFEAENSEV